MSEASAPEMKRRGTLQNWLGRSDRILFFILLALTCAWLLSLPVFPSQDGPAHKYYAHALSRILSGDAFYAGSYTLRHPIPPYASQDFFLLFLSHVMSFDQADKLFVCLIVIATAVGLRLCCLWIGKEQGQESAGGWASLFIFPLLLNAPLMLGFMNYSLGVGVLLLMYACWLRATDSRPAYWWGFAALTAVITVTHPLPLVLLLGLCCFDAATQALQARRRREPLSPRALLAQLLAILLLVVATAYPLLIADRTRTTNDLWQSMFRLRAYLSGLTLYGVSPYYRHSEHPMVLLYKLLLYVILFGGLALGARGLRQRWRAGTLSRADYMLMAAVLLYVALPLLPDSANGSVWFATRLFVMVWLGALMAASGAALSARSRAGIAIAAVLAWVITFATAERFLRPVADEVAAVGQQQLPEHQHVLLLLGELPDKMLSDRNRLEFDPFQWSALLAFMRHDDIAENSPWLDQSVYPVAAGNDPRMMIRVLRSKSEQQGIDLHDEDIRYLPTEEQDAILRGTDLLYVYGVARTMDGKIPLLSEEQQRRLRCEARTSYTLCFRADAPLP